MCIPYVIRYTPVFLFIIRLCFRLLDRALSNGGSQRVVKDMENSMRRCRL